LLLFQACAIQLVAIGAVNEQEINFGFRKPGVAAQAAHAIENAASREYMRVKTAVGFM
jgi:hypothetical protein